MGGGSNSSPPVDVAPGGGTYPTDIFGTAYNPAWGGSPNALAAIGAGMQAFGKGSSVGSSPISFGSAPNIQGSQIPMYGQGGSQIQSAPQDQYSTVLAQALNALIGKSV